MCIARLLLHDVERAVVQKPGAPLEHPHTLGMKADIAASMLRIAHSLGATGRCAAEEISPFCIEAMYRSGIFYGRRFRDAREQSDADALEDIKNGLSVISARWRAAGTQIVTASRQKALTAQSFQEYILKYWKRGIFAGFYEFEDFMNVGS
jgi:hypothetical protein